MSVEKPDLAALAARVNKMLGDDDAVVLGSDLNYTEIPRVTTGLLSLDVALGGGWPTNQWNEIYGEECLAPGTKVLCADLTWRNIEDLSVGDEVIGFDEQVEGYGKGKTSRYRKAAVTSLGRADLPTYAITTQYGVTYASAGHLWLTMKSGRRQWVRTDELREGHHIGSIGAPWETETSWEAGYLSGFYDGEGWVSSSNTVAGGPNRVGIAHAVGDTADFFIALLEKFGFDLRIHDMKPQRKHWQWKKQVKFAGRYEDMRFLGRIRPPRLLSKADTVWEGSSTKQVHGSAAVVKNVEPIGVTEVVTIGTSTKTLIADGMLSHNSSGKTATLLKTIAANMDRDPEWTVLWIAAEEFVPSYADMIGVDLKRVHIANTNVMEHAYQITCDYLDAHAVDCVVIDSLPALTPNAEGEDAMEKFHVGLGARLTGQFFRKARKAGKRSLTVAERPVLGLMVNQFREKIGVMYGDNRTTPGGKAKNFAYFTRIEVRRDEWLENDLKGADKLRIGQTIKARSVKNKSAPGQRIATYDFYYDKGGPVPAGQFDMVKDVFTTAAQFGIISRKGPYYYFGDHQWQGRAAAADALREDPEVYAKVWDETMKAMKEGQ